MVDTARVADFAREQAGVAISRDYKYMCSDPGQELIGQDIKDYQLNRIIVASCSPLLHEPTFRSAVEKGGLNPYYFQMVNIREHNSWVHEDRIEATKKAEELLLGALQRVPHHKALEKRRVDVLPKALVVGGGIAGIEAALRLADSGKQVTLVEREPTIGGHMALFDKTFPTLDCAACILTPKMSRVKNHENITLWTCSDVLEVGGYVGQFTVKIRRRTRHINEDACVGCMNCVDACVYKKPKFKDEFSMGLAKRKPVFMPFPQATPQVVMIDPHTCIELKSGKCLKTCVEACDRDAIDFSLQDVTEELEVGAIIVSTGFKAFDPVRTPQYGYGKYDQVYTALEVERMLNASGPTEGKVVLKDGSIPGSVAIIHCVGSRDEKTNRWCSKVCCMYSLKMAHLIKEHSGAEIYNFYIDMRTPGKDYDEFYDRLLAEGVHFIRGRVSEVSDFAFNKEEEGRIIVQAEDTLAGFVRRIPVDMVVLSTGLEPREDAEDVRRTFNISCSTGGFFLEKHPKLAPVDTATDGIFLAGSCQGPKDIPETVA